MISKNEVKHIASLARIGLSENEVDKFSKDLSNVLNWIDELKKVDVGDIEPMAHITGIENKTKEDKVKDFGDRDKIIKLFPEEKNGYDKVRSVL